jgi:hypothetical protein
VEGSADDYESVDIAAMLRDSDLSAENRRYVHNALASRMLEGWTPTRVRFEYLGGWRLWYCSWYQMWYHI